MSTPPPRRPLAFGEYLTVTGNTVDRQTAGARRELIHVIQRVVPEFFERLRDQVYPKFARYARVAARTPAITRKGLRRGPGHWELGWRFETWDVQSGRNRFKPLLVSWARDFHCAEETWILEGALRTLAAWYEDPEWLQARDVSRFYLPEAGHILVDYEKFVFEDSGWSPQFETWVRFRRGIQARFKEQLIAYEQKVRKLIESRGGQRVRHRYSVKNFEWFALYQLRGMSSVQIEHCRTAAKGDESTVLKGIHTAERLLGWKSLRSDSSHQLRQ
jgi:hypothetical protein